MKNLTKNHLLNAAAIIGLTIATLSTASAQTALFSYDDGGSGGGTANSGTYHPGDSFTFSIMLAFAPGGSISNLDGLSYWFQQKTPAGSPFNFSITLRDQTGSMFTAMQTDPLSYPQNLNPSNANDLGALIPGPGSNAVGAGSYLIANITVQISQSAPISGTYTLSQTLSGGKTSVIADSAGHTFAIPEADYTITLVPEPATWAAAMLMVFGLLFGRRKWRAARVVSQSN